MPISEPTAVFSIRDDRDMEIKQAVLQVYRALEEKGYNPINQLVASCSCWWDPADRARCRWWPRR